MKHLLLLSMAILILMTSSPSNRFIHAMMEVGIVFHHFVHHFGCQEEGMGIWDFITLHYSDLAKHDHAHHDHDHMPLNNCSHHDHSLIGQQAPYVFHTSSLFLAFPNTDSNTNLLVARSEQWRSRHYTGDIWQPPKA